MALAVALGVVIALALLTLLGVNAHHAVQHVAPGILHTLHSSAPSVVSPPTPTPTSAVHAAPPPHVVVGPHAAVPAPLRHYTVRSGDCLWTIGQKTGTPWRTIAVANHLTTPYTIYPGQSLTL